MEEYSVWGSDDIPPPPARRPSSPLPSLAFDKPTLPQSSVSDGWGDDGGWGTATDEYSVSFSNNTTDSDLHVTTEDIEFEHTSIPSTEPHFPSFGAAGGWGPESPELPQISPSSHHAYPSTSTSTPSSPVLPSHDNHATTSAFQSDHNNQGGFAPEFSPVLPAFPHNTSSTEATSVSNGHVSNDQERDRVDEVGQEEEPEQVKEDRWGGFGEDVDLPPIADLNVKEDSSTQERGWGADEDNWEPEEIPPPLPSFGDSFGVKPKAAEEEVEEGWGKSKVEEESWGPGLEDVEVPKPPKTEEQEGSSWSSAPSRGLRIAKSIPASLVDGIKVESRKFADSEWKVEPDAWGQGGFQEQSPAVTTMLNNLLEPPSLPPSLSDQPTITYQTPLSTLFKQTPTLYPSFREGLDKTALRTAETLKGTGSAAYRNARFGLLGQRSASGAESGPGAAARSLWNLDGSLGQTEKTSQVGDEYDMDGPGANAKSNWWGGGKAEPTNGASRGQPSKKDDLYSSRGDASPAARTSSPGPEATGPSSAIGRFFGRFRNSSPSHSRSGSNEDDPSQWQGDTSYLDDNAPLSKIAAMKRIDSGMNDQLGGLFGDTPASQPRRSASPLHLQSQPEFGGLLGSLSSSAAPTSRSLRNSTRSLDPFDPFGDDDEDAGSGSNGMVPIAPSSTMNVPPIINNAVPSPLAVHSISSPQVQSFPSLAAPQARTVSSIRTSGDDDSFDNFFNSMTSPVSAIGSHPPSSTASPTTIEPPAPIAAPRAVISPPPRTSTLSPPSRSSTISPPAAPLVPRMVATVNKPPARTGSSPVPFAPPPPPLQPVSRGGFMIPPPPPSISPISAPPRSSTPSLLAAPLTPAPSLPPPVQAAAPRPPAPPKSGTSGPLSLDDLSFFES
ncbi:hypothetical protein T439DRAFT_320931 [Meredithblackwellia eburnea MCA 4105]